MPIPSISRRTPGRPLARAGFTLIELLAVIAIILIRMTFLLPKVMSSIQQSKVVACRANLQNIYKDLMIYHMKHGALPNGSGVKFFAALIADGDVENTEENAKMMSCPAVERSALAINSIANPKDWYGHLDTIDGSYSAYAGRNMKDFPLRRWPGSGEDALMADDNDPEMNHKTSTVVLWADGTTSVYELLDLHKQGTLSEDEQVLVVGPESPVEKLTKLSLD